MPQVLIEPGRPDDAGVPELLSALDAYLHALYPPGEFGEEVTHILDANALLHPTVTFFVAREGGLAVGCGAVRRMRDPDDIRYGEIKRMFVQPAFRGRAIGRRLLQAMEAAMRQERIACLRLETGTRQPEARRLYERFGFNPRGSFGGYPVTPATLHMEKPL